MFKRLVGSKTFWLGISGILAAVGAYFGGEIDLTTLLSTGFSSLLAIFIRDGIAKGQ